MSMRSVDTHIISDLSVLSRIICLGSNGPGLPCAPHARVGAARVAHMLLR